MRARARQQQLLIWAYNQQMCAHTHIRTKTRDTQCFEDDDESRDLANSKRPKRLEHDFCNFSDMTELMMMTRTRTGLVDFRQEEDGMQKQKIKLEEKMMQVKRHFKLMQIWQSEVIIIATTSHHSRHLLKSICGIWLHETIGRRRNASRGTCRMLSPLSQRMRANELRRISVSCARVNTPGFS